MSALLALTLRAASLCKIAPGNFVLPPLGFKILSELHIKKARTLRYELFVYGDPEGT